MSWPYYPANWSPQNALTCTNLIQQAYFQLFADADSITPPPYPPPYGFPAYSSVLQMPPSGYTLQYTIQYPSEKDTPYEYFGYVVTGPSIVNSGNTMAAFVFRGTESIAEWMDDILVSNQTELPNELGMVHEGFNSIYNGLSYTNVNTQDSGESLSTVLSYLYSSAGAADLVITGHSLGGALATLMAMDIAANPPGFGSFTSTSTCYTFGSPRVGDPTFAKNFNGYIASGTIVNYRVANGLDIVPKLPPNVYYYTDIDLFDPSQSTVTEYDYKAVGGFCPIDSGLVDLDFHSLNSYAAGLNNLITPPTGLVVPQRSARRRPRTMRPSLVAVPPRSVPALSPSA